MPVTIDEKFDSREATVGIESPSIDLLYVVQGTDDDVTVKATVEATIPIIYAGLPFQDYHISPQGAGVWEVSVRYGKKEPKETGESSFSFDTGGGTTHITQSLQTINKYAPVGKVAPDFKGAIGVTHDSVEGTDVTIPIYNFTETHYNPDRPGHWRVQSDTLCPDGKNQQRWLQGVRNRRGPVPGCIRFSAG